jgi:hypothetical protein
MKYATTRCATIATLAAAILLSLPAVAAPPEEQLNYQGVLRDDTGAPFDGPIDMVFHFWSDSTLGDEIAVDGHFPVFVSGGLFNVVLGGGAWADGPGPGTFNTIGEVFRGYTEVYIQIEVDGELLDPRVRVLAAPYAANAASLEGRGSWEFLDISAAPQTKEGELIVDLPQARAHLAWHEDTGSTIRGYGIHARGDHTGGYFEDTNNLSFAYVAYGDDGIYAGGDMHGGYFYNFNNTGIAKLGVGDRGLEATGSAAGAYIYNTAGGYAYIGQVDAGIRAHGSTTGGYFEDTNSTGEAWVGNGDYGIHALGSQAGGWFQAVSGTGNAKLGTGNVGIDARGSQYGGWFDKIKVDDRVITDVLEILGGSDVAEPFPLREEDDAVPGSVVVIDETTPGGLTLSAEPYDLRVAGVVAGAGGIQPGITLSQGTPSEGDARVALAGRVYCLATAGNGPIRPGDLLTTSDVPGHAMRATDRGLAPGATLGKAMSSLEEGEGLVLVLVNLQ